MATTRTRHTKDGRHSTTNPVGTEQSHDGGKMREAVGEAAEAARKSGRTLAARAKDEAQSYIKDKKEAAAAAAGDVADATRQVAQTLRDRDNQTIAHYTETVADQIEDLGQYIRGLQPGEVMREVESLVRRQPALVFGSLFVAGLALSRFLRASEPTDEVGYQDDYDPEYSNVGTHRATYSGYTGSAPMTRPMT